MYICSQQYPPSLTSQGSLSSPDPPPPKPAPPPPPPPCMLSLYDGFLSLFNYPGSLTGITQDAWRLCLGPRPTNGWMSDLKRVIRAESSTLITNHFPIQELLSSPYIGWLILAQSLQCQSGLMLAHWSLTWASLSSVSADVWRQCAMWRRRGLSPDTGPRLRGDQGLCPAHWSLHLALVFFTPALTIINEFIPIKILKGSSIDIGTL